MRKASVWQMSWVPKFWGVLGLIFLLIALADMIIGGPSYWTVLAVLPLIFAWLVATIIAGTRSIFLLLAALMLCGLAPLSFWYVLRWLRSVLLDLNFKDEAVIASVTGSLMKWESVLAIGAIVIAKVLSSRTRSPQA
uniref:hypothetical protein n=1 Tax=Edaphosphingomonas laterariae TaxID=861865 RepID=UPI000B78107C|nr:hypothetical protein [Sphingomonas laterariae]